MRTCSICPRSDRDRVDAALVSGSPLRAIAGQTGTSKSSLERHRRHVTERMALAHGAQEVAAADTLLAKVGELESRARHLLQKSERRGQLGVSVAALRELRQVVELLARVTGELESGVTINLVQAPEWIAVQRRVLDALNEYPQARIAVARALLPAGSSDA
jgi:hypothetical protein